MSINNIVIRQEADKVMLVINGRALSIPWQHAQEIARGLMQKAKLAEEHAKVNGIIADGALLLRAGVPIGLTDNPLIKERIALEAAHDRTLRRALPGGVKSTTLFGTPGVRHGRPRPQAIGVGGIPSAETMGRIGGR